GEPERQSVASACRSRWKPSVTSSFSFTLTGSLSATLPRRFRLSRLEVLHGRIPFVIFFLPAAALRHHCAGGQPQSERRRPSNGSEARGTAESQTRGRD